MAAEHNTEQRTTGVEEMAPQGSVAASEVKDAAALLQKNNGWKKTKEESEEESSEKWHTGAKRHVVCELFTLHTYVFAGPPHRTPVLFLEEGCRLGRASP